MVKLHTRQKRKFRGFHIPRNRAKRPKSFASEEKAKAYAEKKGIISYKLKNLRHDQKKQKIVIVEKQKRIS